MWKKNSTCLKVYSAAIASLNNFCEVHNLRSINKSWFLILFSSFALLILMKKIGRFWPFVAWAFSIFFIALCQKSSDMDQILNLTCKFLRRILILDLSWICTAVVEIMNEKLMVTNCLKDGMTELGNSPSIYGGYNFYNILNNWKFSPDIPVF